MEFHALLPRVNKTYRWNRCATNTRRTLYIIYPGSHFAVWSAVSVKSVFFYIVPKIVCVRGVYFEYTKTARVTRRIFEVAKWKLDENDQEM